MSRETRSNQGEVASFRPAPFRLAPFRLAPFRLNEATIEDIHRGMLTGELTCQRLVELYLARIAAYDAVGPALNAVQTINPRAMEEAEQQDRRLRTSGLSGALHGIPVLVKDQVETDDMPTTYGSILFKDFVPQRNATIVNRLKAAGAVIIAKTNMGEFARGYAGSAFGVCRNPYDVERHPSGSSAGSGSGVAANFGMVAIGEDTGGSVRGPAAFGNIVGLRPTVPLVSRFGMMPAIPSRDTLGPLARTVRDAAILLDAIAGYDPNDPITAYSVGHIPPSYTNFLKPDGLVGMRIGVIREPLTKDTDPSADDYVRVRSVIDQAVRDLATHGAEIVDPLPIPRLLERMDSIPGGFETEEATNRYLAEHTNSPIKNLQEIVLSTSVLPSRRARLLGSVGRSTTDVGFLHELLMREELRRDVLKAMADHQLDAVVYATYDHEPTLIPPEVMTRDADATQHGSNRTLSPLLGFPAISVPAGFTTEGLPVGIEFMGRPFAEGLLFRIAYGYERKTGHRRSPATTPELAGEA